MRDPTVVLGGDRASNIRAGCERDSVRRGPSKASYGAFAPPSIPAVVFSRRPSSQDG